MVRFEGHYHGWSDAIHWSAHPSAEIQGPADEPAVMPESTGMAPGPGESLIVLAGTTRRLEAAFGDTASGSRR